MLALEPLEINPGFFEKNLAFTSYSKHYINKKNSKTATFEPKMLKLDLYYQKEIL